MKNHRMAVAVGCTSLLNLPKIKIKILLQDPAWAAQTPPWVIPVSDHVCRLCSGLDLVPASDAANNGLDAVRSGNPHRNSKSPSLSPQPKPPRPQQVPAVLLQQVSGTGTPTLASLMLRQLRNLPCATHERSSPSLTASTLPELLEAFSNLFLPAGCQPHLPTNPAHLCFSSPLSFLSFLSAL